MPRVQKDLMDYKKCGEPHVHPLPEGNIWHLEGDCTGNHI